MSCTYPSKPGAAVGAKGKLPRGLERLEVFIWLEEGTDPPGIDQTDYDEVLQKHRAVAHMAKDIRCGDCHDFTQWPCVRGWGGGQRGVLHNGAAGECASAIINEIKSMPAVDVDFGVLRGYWRCTARQHKVVELSLEA